jgi:Icc-related predicted phosphoesterase
VKLVIISDTHGRHEQLGVLRGDVLIHCGDVCLGFKPSDSELDAIDQWFSEQQFSAILCIGGNHDRPMLQRATRKQSLFENAIYLQDETFEYGGFKFYGTPWVPDLYGWAYYQEEEILANKWEQIPLDTDILITHTPPYQLLDNSSYSTRHLGCLHLAERVKTVRPKVHCFGHIHAGYGKKERNGTIFVNASIASSGGMNLPITVNLE